MERLSLDVSLLHTLVVRQIIAQRVRVVCAPSHPFIAWFFIVSYAVAFMHCNTCISILMLCYVYLPATVADLLATLRVSFDAVCDVPSSFDSLATPVLRALLSVMSPTPVDDMETSSVTSDSDESSDSCDESLNSEADDASDSEVMGDCLPDLFERVGNFIFGAARERTPEVCKELALRRRRQDPRPDIARPSPEYLLELKEEEAWQQLQQQRAAARRRRARFSHMLLSSPPMPYQLGYIAFPLPDPPCSDPVASAPQAQPVQPPQATSFTQQPIAQGFTFVKPATFSAWSNNLPNQTFSSFTSASSPFAASASAFGFNKTSTTSTYQNVASPPTASDTPAQAGQSFSFVDPATYTPPPSNPFAAYASASSPFATSAPAFGFNKTSTSPHVQNVASPGTASGTPSQAGQAFSFVDPATYTPPPSNPFAAYASASSPFATSASAFGFNKTSTSPQVQNGTTPPDVGGLQWPVNQPSPSNGPFQSVDPAVWQATNQPTAQSPSTVRRNEEGYEIIDEKSYYAAPAPAPAQPAPEQPTLAQTNANVLRDEEGYEIINENAYYATNVTENPASSTPMVQNVTTPASAAFALPSTPLPVNTISAITAPASPLQNHTPVHNYPITEPVRRTSPFTPTTLNAQPHTVAVCTLTHFTG
ncbi:hypothetical protein PENSPDRAFT_409957 [Peniophora sp. CONT]|nr:hypothetical protein PENSPDRAFT_409957 [Peniophora sp. CONT]